MLRHILFCVDCFLVRNELCFQNSIWRMFWKRNQKRKEEKKEETPPWKPAKAQLSHFPLPRPISLFPAAHARTLPFSLLCCW